MKKIMFNDKYGQTEAVLNGHKTQARRIAYIGDVKIADVGFLTDGKKRGTCVLCDGCRIVARSAYKIGEEVAIAQSYHDALLEWLNKNNLERAEELLNLHNEKGWYSKMSVKASLMPHRIKITNIRVERLQDISDEDCMAEGVKKCREPHIIGYPFGVPFSFFISEDKSCNRFSSPREAYAELIIKVSGIGTWNRNPYVFVYEFELIK